MIPSAKKTIEVSGTPGLNFSGSIGTLQSTRSVSKTIPDKGVVIFDGFADSALAAVLQKQGQSGTLTVNIKRGNRVLATGTTNAAYGVVSVSN